MSSEGARVVASVHGLRRPSADPSFVEPLADWLRTTLTRDALVDQYAHGNQQDSSLELARWNRADPRAQLFERRWLAFAASVYTSHGLLGYADRAIRDALTLRTGRADISARPGYFVAAASPSGSSRPR